MRHLKIIAFGIALMASSSAFAAKRMDCRFHGSSSSSPRFCYSSVEYDVDDGVLIQNYGVGCDGQTIYNDQARYSSEATLDRVSPEFAATPAIEVLPQYAMTQDGTYTAWLDAEQGRMAGLCYVQTIADAGSR